MGILKIITKPDADAMYLENVVNYSVHRHSMITGGFNICPECAMEQMQIVKNYYGKNGGNGLVYFIISFNRNVWNMQESFKKRLTESNPHTREISVYGDFYY